MRQCCTFLLFCFLVSVPAFSEDVGIIQCDPGANMASVPAFVAPGKPGVFEQLSCGQMVTVIGKGSFAASSESEYSARPLEYAKIQIGDKVAYVDSKYVKISKSQQPKVSKTEKIPVQKPATREEEEQKKWNLVTKEKLKLRDEMLLNPIYTNGPRTFTATVSNNSDFPVSNLNLNVRIYDCSGKPQSDYSNCETIGEVKSVIPASVPPGQTRLVSGPVMFEATPRVKGTFAWGYWILGVRAE